MRTYIAIGSVILLLVVGVLLYREFIKKPVITIYIENASFDLPVVDLKVHVDDELIVEDVFKVDSVAPSFSIYELKTEKGMHVLRVTSESQNLFETDTLEVKEDKYIFVSFDYKLKGHYQYEQEKLRFKSSYPTDRYPDKQFEFDSVAVAAEIRTHVTSERPVLQ